MPLLFDGIFTLFRDVLAYMSTVIIQNKMEDLSPERGNKSY